MPDGLRTRRRPPLAVIGALLAAACALAGCGDDTTQGAQSPGGAACAIIDPGGGITTGTACAGAAGIGVKPVGPGAQTPPGVPADSAMRVGGSGVVVQNAPGGEPITSILPGLGGTEGSPCIRHVV